jgi:[ribosomal protein S18]-alanine N-acetyltransferase
MPRTTPTIRLATLADAYAIAQMSRDLIESGLGGWAWNPDRVARSIKSPNSNVLVATVREHIVGFAIMDFGDNHAHLSLFAVRPSHQRCGIGRLMMEWLETTALVAGISSINLELRANNQGAHDFYRTLGFTQTAYIPGYYSGVETALRMSRDIRRSIPDAIN